MYNKQANTMIAAEQIIIDYLLKFGKKEAYLLNNRLFFNKINRTDIHKKQYDINREYIKQYNR